MLIILGHECHRKKKTALGNKNKKIHPRQRTSIFMDQEFQKCYSLVKVNG